MTVVEDWFSADRATFGDRLAAAREAKGFTTEALAERIGVRPEVLDGWENDLAEPPSALLAVLEQVLDQPGEWMVTGEGDGLSGPVAAPDTLASVLDDLARLRGQLDTLVAEVGKVEARLRGLIHG